MSSPSPADEDYRAPVASASGELREKGSRFLAELIPVENEVGARQALGEVERRHRGATHHCWAWRIGWPPRERSTDAGEPAGTAGKPILQVLIGARLSDTLMVATRWYGGVKLGKGGLARAYAGAAAAAVASASLEERRPVLRYRLTTSYGRMGPISRLLAKPGVSVVREDFAERVEIVVSVERASVTEFESSVADLGPDVELHRINCPNSP